MTSARLGKVYNVDVVVCLFLYICFVMEKHNALLFPQIGRQTDSLGNDDSSMGVVAHDTQWWR